jgi:two-component system, OmpR family, sensor histidine kinase CiaH
MFQSARIKLTVWYVLIICFICLAFSSVLYRALSGEIERFARIQRFRIERRFQDSPVFFPSDTTDIPLPSIIDIELVEDTKHRIILFLAIVNSSILLLSAILSYILAGKTLKPIQEMVTLQNRFISDASHEFRTPLTSLKAAMEVFLRDKNQTLPEAKLLITDSLREVNTMASLSEALLELSNYERTNNNISFSIVNVETTIKAAVALVKPLALQKEIIIDAQLKEMKIHGHEKSLTQLWIILLDNAIKYSKENTKVSLIMQKIDGSCIVKVVDCGMGIGKVDLPHIFDRFYRADKSRTKEETRGFGLGLSIAKEIVNSHHGSISVVSEEQKGTTFTVRLPKKQ